MYLNTIKIEKVKDCKEAWDMIKSFLENQNETHIFLKMDADHSKNGYSVVKLPYKENIYLLYAITCYNSIQHPGSDLKYAGFYHRKNKQLYNIQGPLTCLSMDDHTKIYDYQTKNMVIEAIQQTVAKYIIEKSSEYKSPSLNDNDFYSKIINDLETTFIKKDTWMNFSAKIPVNTWEISENDMVEYIDNPANIDNPESILKRKIDGKIKINEKNFIRLWFAHCTAQKLLDRLYSEHAEEMNKQSSGFSEFQNEINYIKFHELNSEEQAQARKLIEKQCKIEKNDWNENGIENIEISEDEILYYANEASWYYEKDVLTYTM